MRLALVVVVACSCGSITPVSPLTSSDAGGESRLDTYQPDQTSQADAAGAAEAAPLPPPACTMADTISGSRCDAPSSYLNGLQCLRCYWNNVTAVAPTPCLLYMPVAPAGVSGVCVRSCNDCGP